MCGICGFTENDMQLLANMCDLMAHRGPDGGGSFVASGISLGHKRLSIIGLDSGAQPLFSEDANVVLVCNGEIYNYLVLREKLQAAGHTFTTNSDCEVIVHLYESYGRDCVQYLEGMFAFALWDVTEKRLMLARDRMGIKPLYYHLSEGFLIFASEIKSILLHTEIERRVNCRGLDALLTYKHIPGEETLLLGIRKLLPGHTLVWERGAVDVRPYWSVPMKLNHRPGEDLGEDFYVAGLSKLIDGSVKSHMMSDVPFGATLSGGLDSSLIVALMSQYADKPVKTFSVGFGDENDELPYAEIVANHFKTDHISFRENCEGFLGIIPYLLWHTEEPIAGALLPTYLLAKKASEHVKVLLVGEGADELFAGYVRFKTLQMPLLHHKTRAWAYRRGLNAISEAEKTRMYDGHMRKVKKQGDAARCLEGYFSLRGSDRINKMLKFEQESQLPNHQLLRVDKLTMEFSVEARVPFLDHKLVEFANQMPSSYKLRHFNEKYILKKVAKGLLPEIIVNRRKRGLSSPISAWYHNGLKDIAMDFLSEGNIAKRGYFKSSYVNSLIASSGKKHLLSAPEFKVNMLVMIELWHRMFIDPVNFGPDIVDQIAGKG